MLKLKEILKEKGKTGKELAELVEVTPATISNIINGNHFPKPELLKQIALVLDVDIRELFIPTKEEKQDFDFKCPNCGTELVVNKKK